MSKVNERIKILIDGIKKDLLDRFELYEIDDIMLDIDELRELINELRSDEE